MSIPLRTGRPGAEVAVDEPLVRRLLAAQHPDLAERPLERVGEGWDNVMFLLGDDLAVRLPRRALGARLMEHELRWLAEVAAGLSIPAPVPVREGRPGEGYPWPWSVVPWLPGEPSDLAPPAPSEAPRLARFLRGLHRPAPEDAPQNDLRGVPLAARGDDIERRIERARRETDLVTPGIERAWREALAASASAERLWLHGDLHPQNLLVAGGEISAVIDWGDLTVGDPATDLAVFWMLFDDPEVRREGLEVYGASDELIARARGWAVFFGVTLGVLGDERHRRVGRATLRRLA